MKCEGIKRNSSGLLSPRVSGETVENYKEPEPDIHCTS
jgi:hypothetical protein